MSDRHFFALWPEGETGEELRDQIVDLMPLVLGEQGVPLIRGNLHITLGFLGSVRPEQMDCVQVSGQAVAQRNAPFSITLSQSGWWKGPRVAWIAPANIPKALAKLESDLWHELAACEFAPEARPYRPHMTIARKMKEAASNVSLEPVHWQVGGFSLIRSTSTPGGVRYAPVQSGSLVGSGSE